MNNAALYLLNRMLPVLPDTRLYRLRARLWRAAGIEIDITARVVCTVRIMGCFPLAIGRDTYVGHETLIIGGEAPISIGSHCDIGPRVTIVNGSHELGHSTDSRRAAAEGVSKSIVIENGVWIGASSTVLGGVRIGTRAVIGAGSVVVGDIPPDTIAVGVPCRPVRKWDAVVRCWNECR